MNNMHSNGLYTDDAPCQAFRLNSNRFETNTKQIKGYLMKLTRIMQSTLFNKHTDLLKTEVLN